MSSTCTSARPGDAARDDGAVDDARRVAPASNAALDEVVAVARVAQRDEARAAVEPPRVERPRVDARAGVTVDAPAAPRARSPPRSARSRHASSSSRATTRSSNGTVTPLAVWPVSWPLPAITTTSPARASRSAWRIAARRSSSTTAPVSRRRTPASTSAAIAAGILRRGLSEVRIATSRASSRDLAHQRALRAVAVAAAPEHDDHPAAAADERARGAEHRRASASGVCA